MLKCLTRYFTCITIASMVYSPHPLFTHTEDGEEMTHTQSVLETLSLADIEAYVKAKKAQQRRAALSKLVAGCRYLGATWVSVAVRLYPKAILIDPASSDVPRRIARIEVSTSTSYVLVTSAGRIPVPYNYTVWVYQPPDPARERQARLLAQAQRLWGKVQVGQIETGYVARFVAHGDSTFGRSGIERATGWSVQTITQTARDTSTAVEIRFEVRSAAHG